MPVYVPPNPVLAYYYVAGELRRLETDSGLTRNAAAKIIGRDPAALGHVLDGKWKRISDTMKRGLERAYRIRPPLAASLWAAERIARGLDKWRARFCLSERDTTWIGLEQGARTEILWETLRFPWLLAGDTYGRYRHQARFTDETFSPDLAEAMGRRRLTYMRSDDPLAMDTRPDTTLLLVDAILWETVIHAAEHTVDRDVLAVQLLHLRKVAELPNVRIRIYPLAAPLPPTTSPFALLDFTGLPAIGLAGDADRYGHLVWHAPIQLATLRANFTHLAEHAVDIAGYLDTRDTRPTPA